MSVFLISHFHWDREWYRTFEAYRGRLVDAIDRVLDLVAEDPDARFVLDGQAILLEDYLLVRPDRRAELAQGLARGRLAAGPWYVQPDVLLPSGESLVRNLLIGRAVASALARPPVTRFIAVQFWRSDERIYDLPHGRPDPGYRPSPLGRVELDGLAAATGGHVFGESDIGGAVAALRGGKSLLPAGVVRVDGGFDRGDAVIIRGPDGVEVGRGLCAYDAEDAQKIRGRSSADIDAILGFSGRAEMVHRDDLVVGR